MPAASLIEFESQAAVWAKLDDWGVKQCVDEEFNNPRHPDALKCSHDRGNDKTYFDHEHVTPRAYWSESLAAFFLLDCILTAMLIGAYFVGRWVVRGFTGSSASGK